MLFQRKYNITSEHNFTGAGLPAGEEKARPSSGRAWDKVLGLGGGPALGFDIGENRVAHLNGLKLMQPVGRDLMTGFETPPGIDQRAELFQVGGEALLGVVARVLGGDQELPVRR